MERYPIVEIPGAKELIKAYWDQYSPASDGMLCFDEDYEAIAKHMRNIPDIQSVTDIGCAWGVQNLFFLDKRYIGIDMHPAMGYVMGQGYPPIPFFREGQPNVQYHITRFPDGLTDEMVGDAFITNMSLGYARLDGIDGQQIIDAISRFRHGYFRAAPEIEALILSAFPHHQVIHHGVINRLISVSQS